MSNAVTGQSGGVVFGSAIAEVKSWQVTPDVNTPDITSMDSGGWGDFLAGIKTWAGSFESLVCVSLVGSVGVASFSVGTASSASTPVYSGTVIVKGPGVACDVAGEVRYSYQFQGKGPLTIAVG